MNRRHALARGFTLVEALVVVSLLATLAAVALPSLSTLDDRRLEVAGGEVRNALRLARAEALRRGKSVLVDAESSPGHVKLLVSACSSYGNGTAVTDPRTKSNFDLDVTGGPFSAGVAVTPRFLASGGSAYGGLVFGADGSANDVCQVTGSNSQGTPQAGSQVLLSLGPRQAVVAIDPPTGRVTGP